MRFLSGDLCVALLCVYLCICGAHAFVYINVLVCAPICECARVCVYVFLVWGFGLWGQLCVSSICHPTLVTPKGMAGRGVGNSFWKEKKKNQGPSL